jgi:hypothetical protein
LAILYVRVCACCRCVGVGVGGVLAQFEKNEKREREREQIIYYFFCPLTDELSRKLRKIAERRDESGQKISLSASAISDFFSV